MHLHFLKTKNPTLITQHRVLYFSKKKTTYFAAAAFAKCSFTHSVVTDFGRSNGKPNARDQQSADKTPSALDTPNNTV